MCTNMSTTENYMTIHVFIECYVGTRINHKLPWQYITYNVLVPYIAYKIMQLNAITNDLHS